MRVLVLVLTLVSSAAKASPTQFVGDVSLSAGFEHWSDWQLSDVSIGATSLTPDYQSHALLALDGGIKVSHDLALIVHGSVTSPRYLYDYTFCDDPFPGEIERNSPFHYIAIEAGVGIDWATDGGWVSPWIGMLKIEQFGDRNTYGQDLVPVVGLTAGFDVAADDAGNRLAIVGNVSYARLRTDSVHDEENSSYFDFTGGLAYRFW